MISPTTVAERLPSIALCQELLYQIFGNLDSDFASLKSCSLVCWSWLFGSRIHLFRRVLIRPSNIRRLMEFLFQHPHSNILIYIRQLEFRGHSETPLTNPTALLRSLPSVLTHLHFHDTIFETFDALLGTICGFPALQSLVLNRVQYPELKNIDFGKRVLPSFVDHLCLRDTPLRLFMLWLTSHPELPQVSHVDIGPIDEPAIPYVGIYLVQIAPSLRHLAFSFGFGASGHICVVDMIRKSMGAEHQLVHEKPADPTIRDLYQETFGIPACTNFHQMRNLDILRIDGFVDSAALHQSTALFWAPRVCASIASYNIRRVILGLTLACAAELDQHNINWEFFNEVFASEIYNNLESIDFEIRGRVNIDGIANLIASKLPKAASRGLLRFRKMD